MQPKKFSFAERLKSFSFAFKGIFKFFKHEHNARIHLAAICLIIPLALYLDLSRMEWSLLTIAIALVLITELINTSIESVCDLIEPNYNKIVEDAKDYAAGATLIAAIAATILGGVIFLPKLWTILM